MTEIGGLSEGSFSQSAWAGIQRFQRERGLPPESIAFLESATEADFLNNMTSFAKRGFDLVVAPSWLFTDALGRLAPRYPRTKFLILDAATEAPNVVSATFAEHEGSFLAGVAAGLKAKRDGQKAVGYIGGLRFPLIEKFEAGFSQGVLSVFPECRILVDYAGGFTDSAVGRSLASKQYGAGAYVIYHTAGAVATGIIREAMERTIRGDTRWVVGVDTDQYDEGLVDPGRSVILTSMVKRLDVATAAIAALAMDGSFPGGKTIVFGLAEKGLGLPSRNPSLDADILEAVASYESRIASGEIHVVELPSDVASALRLGPATAQGAATQGAGASGEPVKIGWYYALTGDEAIWGQCELDTLTMLVEEMNAAGGVLGRPIELIAYDNRGDGTESVAVAQRLVRQDKVCAILGPGSSGQAIPVVPILTAARVPGIATTATNPRVTVTEGEVNPYSFRVCFIDPYQGELAAAYAYRRLGARKAALLFDSTDAYSSSLASSFEAAFSALGGTTLPEESYQAGDRDFSAQLGRIKAGRPHIIFIPVFYPDAASIAAQARRMGIKQAFVGGDGWDSESLLEMAGGALEGSFFIRHVDAADPLVQDYRLSYQARFGVEPQIDGYLAYDAFYLLMDAILRAGKAEGPAIAAALETADIEGITGRIRIGRDSHNPEGKEAAIVKIQGGAFVFQERFYPGK